MEGEGEAAEGQGGVRVSPRQVESPHGEKTGPNKISHASDFCSVVLSLYKIHLGGLVGFFQQPREGDSVALVCFIDKGAEAETEPGVAFRHTANWRHLRDYPLGCQRG